MHHATATTIRATLARIERREIVLPAIQREFVWKPEQICKLFDSLLRGYPIGQLLYWLVRGENLRRWRWYDPVTDWHEKDAKHCPAHGDVTDSGQMLTAVLDGQQRLTALNVGLRGSLAPKLPRYWWDNPGAFPKRRMHLILDNEVQCLTQGETQFRWLTSEEGEKAGGAVFPGVDPFQWTVKGLGFMQLPGGSSRRRWGIADQGPGDDDGGYTIPR